MVTEGWSRTAGYTGVLSSSILTMPSTHSKFAYACEIPLWIVRHNQTGTSLNLQHALPPNATTITQHQDAFIAMPHHCNETQARCTFAIARQLRHLNHHKPPCHLNHSEPPCHNWPTTPPLPSPQQQSPQVPAPTFEVGEEEAQCTDSGGFGHGCSDIYNSKCKCALIAR